MNMVRTAYDFQYSSQPVDSRLFGKYQGFYEEMQAEFNDAEREDLLPDLKTLVEYLIVFQGEGLITSSEGYKAYSSYINQLFNMIAREKCPETLVETLFEESVGYAKQQKLVKFITKKTKYFTSMQEFKDHFGLE